MKPHTKNYLRFFNYTEADYIACEVCSAMAVDIHHIEARGMGGGRGNDSIENLMALCRTCHLRYGDKKQFMEMLRDIHITHINKRAKLN